MTAFIGAPGEPHIGQCQNFIRGERANWADAYYCLNPVLALGAVLRTDRDICQECKAKTERFSERLVASHVEAIRSGGMDEWVARTQAQIVDMSLWYTRRASERAPLEDLYRIDRELSLREKLLAAVLSGGGQP